MVGMNRRGVGQFQKGGFENQIVKVSQITPEKGLVLCVDAKNQEFRVPLGVQPSSYRLPRAGEYWYIEKVLGQWTFKSLMAESIHQYYQHHEVEVESLDGDTVVVHTTEDPNRKFNINKQIQRYKSYEQPQVGETWIIDNALGEYTFAAFIGSSEEPVIPEVVIPEPVDAYPVSYISSATHMGSSTGSFVAYGSHPWLLARVPTSGKLMIEIGSNNIGNWNTNSASISVATRIYSWSEGPNEFHGYTRDDADADPSPGSAISLLVEPSLDNAAYTQFPSNTSATNAGTTVSFTQIYSGLPAGELVQVGVLGRISSGSSSTHVLSRSYALVTPVQPFLMSED